MRCPNHDCAADVPEHERHCVVCDSDAGYPNVRAASQPEELAALQDRADEARVYAESEGIGQVLDEFREAAGGAKAVVAMPVAKLSELVSSDNALYRSFYKDIEAGNRIPESNEWDPIRQSADALLFPHYHPELKFGALALDGLGVAHFGGVSVTLRDGMIRERASVFEENTVDFVRKHRIVVGDPLPKGYRAKWESRGELAAAKLARKIVNSMTRDEFPNLLRDGGDFVEVHVYGPIHRRAIERLTGSRPTRREDRVLLRSIKRKMEEIGASFEIN